MADNKKSFVAYVDWKSIFNMLEDVEAGRLIKHLFSYVSDENPELDDRILKMAFEPIKLQLKRDLEKYESVKERRAEAGRKGGIKSGEVRKQTEPNEAIALNAKQTEPNEAVTDTDTVTVNVTDTVNVKTKEILMEERKLKFASTLEFYKNIYPRSLLSEFYKYWGEPNKSRTKFKQELEKTWDLAGRLETWARNDKSFKNGKTSPQQQSNESFKVNR
jgi:hypothetical protein